MSFARSFFHRTREDPFADWPVSIPIPSVPARVSEHGTLPGKARKSVGAENAGEFVPTLLIGLGNLGEQVFRLLEEKFAHLSVSWPETVPAFLFSASTSDVTFLSNRIRVHQIQQPITLSLPKGGVRSQREKIQVLFGHTINYKKYQEWTQEQFRNLENGLQVFFIASLFEAENAILGDALQILRLLARQTGKSTVSRVVLFLVASTAGERQLPEEEAYAAFREIGRLTFPEKHIMKTSFGLSPSVEGALSDFVFFIEEEFPSDSGSSIAPQLVAETIFTLSHSSAISVWENITNDLRVTGNIRDEAHLPVVHGVGIASVYLPLASLKRYIALRLVQAVLWGEHPSRPEEGMIPVHNKNYEPDRLARRIWLKQRLHPFFDWLLELKGPEDLKTLPRLPDGFEQVIAAQIAHGLLDILYSKTATLSEIGKALEWLVSLVLERKKWFQQAHSGKSYAPEAFSFEYLLNQAQLYLENLIQDVKAWEKALSPSKSSYQAKKNFTWRSAHPSESKNEVESFDAFVFIKEQRERTEQELLALSNNPVACSIALGAQKDLSEIDTYYAENVRPELSRYTDTTSPIFERIRGRLDWWIRLVPGSPPRLLLLCWPVDRIPVSNPPADVCLTPQQADRCVERLIEIALAHTEMVEQDLTTVWFQKQVPRFADFLRRAQDVSLEYDRDETARFAGGGQRRSYLISNDPLLNRDLLGDVFPQTPRLEVNEIAAGHSTRVTALTLRLNILSSSVVCLRELRERYQINAFPELHLYSPEQTALKYERHFWRNERQRVMLCPEITSLLPEPRLVTLFFQALFCGVIYQSDQFWRVRSVKNYSELVLAPKGENGLYEALKRFALEIPWAPDLNQQPAHPFHPSHREHYLASLIEEVKNTLYTPQRRAIQDDLDETEFSHWKERADKDLFARSFYVLLRCELDEPLWSGW